MTLLGSTSVGAPERPLPSGHDGSPAAGWRSGLSRAVRVLWAPLVVGIAVRLVLIPFTSWSKDDSIWWLATSNGLQHLGLYQRAGFSYPPLSGDLLQGIGWILQHFGLTTHGLGVTDLRLEPAAAANQFSMVVTTPLFNLCFKGLLLLLDLGSGLILYELCRRLTSSEPRARLAFALWFLNPFVIMETAVFGAFDQLVAFTVLAAVALFLAGRHLWAGVALGMAVMAKGAPGFLLPLLALTLAARAGGPLSRQARATIPLLGGVAASCAVLALPLLLTHQVGAAFHAVFARTSGTQYGGFAVLGLLSFRGIDTLGNSLGSWSQLGHAVLALQCLAGVALGAWGAARARRDPVHALVSTAALVLTVVVMLGPDAHPQYLLWFLPEIVLLVAAWHRARLALLLSSAIGLVFVVALYGPAAFVFPFTSHGWVSPRALIHDVLTWDDIGALPWSSGVGFINWTGPFALAGLATTASVVRAAVRPLGRRRRAVAGSVAVAGVAPAVAVLLVAATGSSLAVAASTRGADVRLTAAASSHGLSVQAMVRPGASLEQLRLVEFPVSNASLPQTVDLYVDDGYPVNGSTKATVQGTAAALGNLLALRGFGGQVQTVDTAGLLQVLHDTAAAPTTAVVDVSGILPLSSFSARTDLVLPWLRAGGTLYWGGSAPGFLSGQAGQPDNLPPSSYPGSLFSNGVARFYPLGLFRPVANPFTVGTHSEPAARALGLLFQLNQYSPSTQPVTGGVSPAGWTSAHRSSVTVVQEGQGQLVQLGGLVYNPRLVAPDLSLLLMSGITRSDGPVASVDVPAGVARHGGRVRWAATSSPAPTYVVLAFDPSSTGLVFERVIAQ